jgi:Zn-dependent protease
MFYTSGTEYFLKPILVFIAFFIYINLILGFFNLLPIPPLDGGRIGVSILESPHSERLASLEPYGMLIIIGLAYAGAWRFILEPLVIIGLKALSWVAGINLLLII